MELKDGQLLFGIGMNKTGTNSLATALRKLGISCLHNSTKVKTYRRQNIEAGQKILHGLDHRYRAFCDSPIPYFIDEIQRDYPGSRYILTIRDIKAWVKSRLRHFGGTVEHHLSEWQRHLDRLQAAFGDDMSGILVYDRCGGDGWAPLCEWLSKSVPQEPFPHKNRTKKDQVQRRSRTHGWNIQEMRREVARLREMDLLDLETVNDE